MATLADQAPGRPLSTVEVTDEKKFERFVPMNCKAAMPAKDTKATTKPYSIAVAPISFFMNVTKVRMAPIPRLLVFLSDISENYMP